jgi:hypothetical protein
LGFNFPFLVVSNIKLNTFVSLDNSLQLKKIVLEATEAGFTNKPNLLDPLVGSILTPFILLINTFASFLLPNELK